MTRSIVPRYLLGTVTAAALAFAVASATPARAGSDTARIITGVAALAIIGAAIASSRDRHRDSVDRYRYGYNPNRYPPYGYRPYRQRPYGYIPYRHRPYGYGYRGYHRRGHGYDR